MENSQLMESNDFLKKLQPGQVGLTLFEALPDVILWVKDIQGKFVFVNDAFRKGIGELDEDKILGRSDLDLFPAVLAAVFRADDLSVTTSGEAVWNKRELVYNGETGGVEWRATSKVPLLDLEGKIVGTAGVSRPLGHMEGCPVPSQHRELSAIIGAVYKCLDQDLRVAEIAEAANTSVSTLERAFKEHMNTTPKKFITQAKISTACEKLICTNLSVKEISGDVGFKDNASFTRSFKRLMGQSPSEYRAAHGGS